jgi:hypothetical protein
MSTPYPLGWIEPAARTQAQWDAHHFAARSFVRQHGLTAPDVPKGSKLILTDFWKHPDVVADLGRPFIRELQNTGSCVKVGGTNALRVSIAGQRVAGESPTKAFEPFCWHNYAMSRHYFGDDGQGEGSMGSTFAKSLQEDGVTDWPQDGGDALPDYKHTGDHINITSSEEMKWSSYRNPEVQKMLAKTKEHKLGSAAELNGPADYKAMALNGYGIAWACNNFIGNASIHGSGDTAYVRGRWDGRGGHQQWMFGYWEHPNDGPLYAVGNNWPDDTYPADPAGLPLCCCWVAESDVVAASRLDAEVYAYSRLNWFPAAPGVLSWLI